MFRLAKETIWAFQRDGAASMGAALAFYSAFSIAPLLIIAISIASSLFGSNVRAEVLTQLQSLLGMQGALAVEAMLEGAGKVNSGRLATTLGLLALFFGATSVFAELEAALNKIWDASPRVGAGIWNYLRTRVLSFGLVLTVGFLMLVSLLVSAALASTVARYQDVLGGGGGLLMLIFEFAVTVVGITFMFAMIYKWLPNVRIAWRDVWLGALVTALLFTVGRTAIGFYLGSASVASAYGAAGSFVVLLLWLFYSAQVFLLGAEFTWIYARRRNTRPPTASTEATRSFSPPELKPWVGRLLLAALLVRVITARWSNNRTATQRHKHSRESF